MELWGALGERPTSTTQEPTFPDRGRLHTVDEPDKSSPRLSPVKAPPHIEAAPNYLMTLPGPARLQLLSKLGALVIKRDPASPIFSTDWAGKDAGRVSKELDQLRGRSSGPLLNRRRHSQDAEPSVVVGASAMHTLALGAWRMFTDWPSNWHATLMRLVDREHITGEGATRFPTILAEVFDKNSPHWGWLHASYLAFIAAHGPSTPRLFPWTQLYKRAQVKEAVGENAADLFLSPIEAARSLGMAGETSRSYIVRGKLKATPLLAGVPNNRYHNRRLISAVRIAQLRLEREGTLSLREAAESCGVTPHQITPLWSAGLLQAAHGPGVDGAPTWRFTHGAARDFRETLFHAIPACAIETSKSEGGYLEGKRRNGDSLVPLSRVLLIAGWHRLNLPQILRAALDGSLPALRAVDGSRWLVDLIWFEPEHIRRYLAETCRERVDDVAVYSQEEVVAMLGCRKTKLVALRDSGVLVPIKTVEKRKMVYYYYSAADIQRYLDQYMWPEQVAEMLRLSRLTVVRWAARGRIPAATVPALDGGRVYRFDREEITRWRHERLTTREALEVLGVSRMVLDGRVAKGQISPLQDMGSPQGARWWGRTDIERLRDELQPPNAGAAQNGHVVRVA